MSKVLIKGGTIVNEGRSFLGDLLVDGEVISDIFEGMAPRGIYDEVVDATGCFVLPGVIDDHVHFREPALTPTMAAISSVVLCSTCLRCSTACSLVGNLSSCDFSHLSSSAVCSSESG